VIHVLCARNYVVLEVHQKRIKLTLKLLAQSLTAFVVRKKKIKVQSTRLWQQVDEKFSDKGYDRGKVLLGQ